MLRFSRDGTRIAYSYAKGSQGAIAIFDTMSSELLRTIGNVNPRSFAFSPDGSSIAALHRGVSLFDIATGEPVWNVDPNFETVKSVDFSPDGRLLAAAGEYETDWDFNDPDMTSIALYDVSNRTTLWEKRAGLYEKVLFTPNGQKLFTIGTGSVNRNLTSSVSSFQVPGGEHDAEFAEKNRLRFWDFDLSSDGSTLLCGGGYYHRESTDFPIILVDLNSERVKIREPQHIYRTKAELQRLEGHTKAVNSVAFGPGGKMAASASADGTVRVWYLDSGTQVKEFSAQTDCVTFTPDGAFIVFMIVGCIVFFDTKTWEKAKGINL